MWDLRLIWSRCLSPILKMEESRSVTPWVNRLYFESPRVSSFLGLRLVKKRHKNLVPLSSGVKPDPMVGSGRYVEPIPVKSPLVASTGATFTAPFRPCGLGIGHLWMISAGAQSMDGWQCPWLGWGGASTPWIDGPPGGHQKELMLQAAQ